MTGYERQAEQYHRRGWVYDRFGVSEDPRGLDSLTSEEERRIAVARYNSAWSLRMLHAVGEERDGFKRFQEWQPRADRFIADNIGVPQISPDIPDITDRLASFFAVIDWKQNSDTVDSRDFTDLAFFGIETKGVEALWGDLVYLAGELREGISSTVSMERLRDELAKRKSHVAQVKERMDKKLKGFCNNNPDKVIQATAQTYRQTIVDDDTTDKTLEYYLVEKVEETIADRLKLPQDRVPIPYTWLQQFEDTGLITPQLQEIIALNQTIINGDQIDLYCCPNYSTEQREDGVHVYTFENLGTNIGLTAERSFPFLTDLIDRTNQLTNEESLDKPIKVRVGIADFEATPDNAHLVGLTVDQFKSHLGESVANMVQAIQSGLSSNEQHKVEYNLRRVNNETESIGEYLMQVTSNGRIVANISFGAITQNYVGKVEGYEGKSTFDQMVETKRDELEALVDNNPAVHPALDNTLQVRLGLMLDWEEEHKPPIIDDLKGFFDQVNSHDFHNGIHAPEHLADLKEEVRGILVQDQLDEIVKSQMVKDIMVNWMKTRAIDEPVYAEAINYLRKKIARQGAEYAVMSQLMEQAGTKAQIVADSAPMWQTFGGKNITRVIIKGGYEGSDKDGILQQNSQRERAA